jgi:hypothetical protein
MRSTTATTPVTATAASTATGTSSLVLLMAMMMTTTLHCSTTAAALPLLSRMLEPEQYATSALHLHSSIRPPGLLRGVYCTYCNDRGGQLPRDTIFLLLGERVKIKMFLLKF